MERAWSWPGPPDELLDLCASQPHLVAILPAEYGGQDQPKIAAEDLARRLGGSLICEVEEPSKALALLRHMRGQK
jgi:hypothetical protein